jgi:hypothetical protein
VGEKEQSKFSTIEELLGAPVFKGVVPAEFGPTPEYKPKVGARKSFGKRR